MKSLLLIALLAALPVVAAESPTAPKPAPENAVKRHALRGVVTRIDTERSALMVKHEDIPGVMRAMTMMFKVDATTLKTVKPNDAITGLMSRQGGDWVLEDVKVVPPKK